MSKVPLLPVASIDNSLINNINTNSNTITTAFDNTLSRNGQSPNQMQSVLDMNSNPIINIPFASTPNQPVALGQLTNNVSPIQQLTGDVTGAITLPSGTIPTTIATVNSNVGTFGNTTNIPSITVNAKGQVTAASNNSINLNTINGVSFPANPSTNTVPVVTSPNTITYETVPGSAISTNTITNSNLAQMNANTVKGNNTGSTANVSDLSQTQLTAMVNNFTTSLPGSAPASGGGTTNFLRADGTWAAPAAGAMVLLNTLTASNSATLSDTTSFTNTYSEYEIRIQDLVPATSAAQLTLQVHTGGAFQTTGYISAVLGFNNAATATAGLSTAIQLNQGAVQNTATRGTSGIIHVANPASTTTMKKFYGQMGEIDTSGTGHGDLFSGIWGNNAGAIDGFQLLFTSGNITSGTVKVYGIT